MPVLQSFAAAPLWRHAAPKILLLSCRAAHAAPKVDLDDEFFVLPFIFVLGEPH
jgi:hypothetical protein